MENLKKCIWCSKYEGDIYFRNKAHIVPQSLGGNELCEFVCDSCNSYFGNPQKQTPSIETVIKETFGITRARFLSGSDNIGKNKALARYSSTYFNINWEKPEINIKPKYKLYNHFQESLGNLLRRGVYKMFLEKLATITDEVYNSQYDFIREYSRYNLISYPLIYFYRSFGIIMQADEFSERPSIILKEGSPMKYIIHHESFIEFEFLGHVIAIAIRKNWQSYFNDYILKSKIIKEKLFLGYSIVNQWNDIDITLSVIGYDDIYRRFLANKKIILFNSLK